MGLDLPGWTLVVTLGSGRRDDLHQRQHFRAREALREQQANLAAGLVSGSLGERVSILRSQVGSQPVHGGEMEATVGHSVEDGRELTRRAGGVNALAGSLLGEVQLMPAVEVHGGEADR